MRKNTYLYIFSSIILCLFSFFILSNVYAQGKEFTVDSILINNKEINIKDGCNLKLKYNDVIRIAGRNTPNEKVILLFADQEYATQTDNDGNWMILISIPYVEDGRYKITNDNSTVCEITLDEGEKKQLVENSQQSKKNRNTILILLSSILVLSVLVYVTVLKRKKK